MTIPSARFEVCWTIDCESSRPEIGDLELGRNAILGFANLLEEQGWRGTFFLIPEEVGPMSDILPGLAAKGHEIALHVHPQTSGYPVDYMGSYSGDTQREIILNGLAEFERHLGFRPSSFRPGYCSANDELFPTLVDCSIRQCSVSLPGRRMTALASNWAGAPLFAHYAHPFNRYLTGGLDLVEIPISVDWESQIWNGLHPQDLRVEFTDEKNHGYLIEKIMRRQVEEKLPLKALVILTHNLFRYSDETDFRRQTMLGMISAIRRCAMDLGLDLIGSTLQDAAASYRRAVPVP